jgi:hypothetical protein
MCLYDIQAVSLGTQPSLMPIIVASQSKAWTVFALSDTGIVGWIFVCVYSVFLLSCMQVAALRRADPTSKEFYRLSKRAQDPTKGCRALYR